MRFNVFINSLRSWDLNVNLLVLFGELAESHSKPEAVLEHAFWNLELGEDLFVWAFYTENLIYAFRSWIFLGAVKDTLGLR